MIKIIIKILLVAVLSLLSSFVYANESTYPYCKKALNSKLLIVAYLGADTNWTLTQNQTKGIKQAFNHIDVLNYAFIRFKKTASGNVVLNMTKQDIHNLNITRQLTPNLPILISIGGWQGRYSFQFLSSPELRKQFIQSVLSTLKTYLGVSFWSLTQDLNYNNSNSLLRAIYTHRT